MAALIAWVSWGREHGIGALKRRRNRNEDDERRTMAQTYVAVTTPGLEHLLLQELRRMKIKRPKVIEGGVEFEATSRGLYEVLIWSRIAHRVMLRVTDFRARDQRECYKKTRRYDWERLLGEDEAQQVSVRGVVHTSGIGGSGALSSSVLDGIRDHYTLDLKRAPVTLRQTESAVTQAGELAILARCVDDRCELSLEASSGSMHQRGWRVETGEAPLRESYAAAILEAIEWDGAAPLLDPMCGSGTIVIESARKALGMPPRVKAHHYGALSWGGVDAERFLEVYNAPPPGKQAVREEAPVWGRDKDREVVAKALKNVRRAGVAGAARIEQVACDAGSPPDDVTGWIVSNPPYGERIEEGDSLRDLAVMLRERFQGWRVALLLSETQQPPRTGAFWKDVLSFRNGGLPVKLWVGSVA